MIPDSPDQPAKPPARRQPQAPQAEPPTGPIKDQRQGVLLLLAILMISHLAFLGFRSKDPNQFQQAVESYVTVLLALSTPLVGKGGHG